MPIDVFKHLLSGDQLLRPSWENECATDQPGAGTGFFDRFQDPSPYDVIVSELRTSA